MKIHFTLMLLLVLSCQAGAVTYHVGPGQPYTNLSDVSIESLAAGDSILIHYRAAPYKEKFVIGAAGTQANPVVIMGIPSGNLKPVLEGDGATTRLQLDFWSENRGIIKVGGTSNPGDNAAWIEIRNLEIRTARTGFNFTDDAGNSASYAQNAAAIFIEKGSHITISHCDIHNCGNGIFAAWQSSDIIIEYCHIYDNGIENSIYEHNTYTEAQGIVYQFNFFGRLRTNCPGNNLKDRSAGTVIRYNRIDGGNRQLDLVESGHADLINMPEYRETFVYNNMLIEYEGEGNSQVLHYGGDGGTASQYRKGMLYFYYNTVVSFRTGNTTLMRLSTNEEQADVRNNVIYVTAGGSKLGIVDYDGLAELRYNWVSTGWKKSHGNTSATVTDVTGNLTGSDPLFRDITTLDLYPDNGSPLIDNAGPSHANTTPYPPLFSFDTPAPAYRDRVNDLTEIGAWSRSDATGMSPLKNLNPVEIFPNPATGHITIHLSSPARKTRLQLYSAAGELIWENWVYESSPIIRNTAWPAGIYFLNVQDEYSRRTCRVVFDR